MIHVQTKIQRWGNSLAIRLTGSARTIPHFSENMPIDMEVSEEGISIRAMKTKIKKLPFTEAELLKGMQPFSSDIDELPSLTLKELENT